MTPQAAKLKYSSCLNKDFTYLLSILTYAGEIGIWTRLKNSHYENKGHLLYFTLM